MRVGGDCQCWGYRDSLSENLLNHTMGGLELIQGANHRIKLDDRFLGRKIWLLSSKYGGAIFDATHRKKYSKNLENPKNE